MNWEGHLPNGGVIYILVRTRANPGPIEFHFLRSWKSIRNGIHPTRALSDRTVSECLWGVRSSPVLPAPASAGWQ